MNFTKHYLEEEKVEEAIGDIVKDVATAGVGGIAKAAAKGVGRGIANIARGALGRSKTIAFEPNWLKVLKPVDLDTYKKTVGFYANARNQKTKLGPRKTIAVKDLRDGVLGDFSKDKFEEILGRYDARLKDIVMDAEIKPEISVYLLNDGGKVIFFNLPLDDAGKKRVYAMGLDNKAERDFRLIHGMTFQNYELATSGEKEEEKGTPDIKKVEIARNQYKQLIPKKESEEFSLFNLFKEEVLKEADIKVNGKRAVRKEGDKWYRVKKDFTPDTSNEILTLKNDLIAVDEKGQPDDNAQKQLQSDFEERINKEKEEDENSNKANIEKNGMLYNDLKDEVIGEPANTKETDNAKPGWSYSLKNGGTMYLYQRKEDQKYYLAFDKKAEEVVKKLNLLKKYNLETAPE